MLCYLHELSVRLEIRRPFAVVLVSDRAMRRFNRQFAGKATTTDVLSFPAAEEDWGEEPCLGDIIISVERAEAQGPDTLFRELQRLALHGLLHLLGYDHVADGGEMEALEEKILKEFGLASL